MPRGDKSYALKAVQASTGREPRELLRQLYVDERRSQQEIADALHVSRSAVANWLSAFGITRDERPELQSLVDVA